MFPDHVMPLAQYGLLIAFIVALVGSPGPANMALMASGLTFGARPAVPFLLGTMTGFQIIFWLNVAGLYALLASAPQIFAVLRYACMAYIVYLAWIIVRSRPENPSSAARAPGFPRGVIVHPLSPKAYAMQVAAIAQFVTPERYLADAIVVSLTFWMLGGILNGLWLMAGSWLRGATGNLRALKALRVILAALMVVTTILSLQMTSS
jgi:threonine/homoserine/homoserine lactone efflux protein